MTRPPISKNTAMDIALAYREVEVAEELLAKIEDSISNRKPMEIRDAFGRLQDGLQLGVPTGDSGQRLFNVPWALAKPIIETHIAAAKSRIAILTEKAMEEARF